MLRERREEQIPLRPPFAKGEKAGRWPPILPGVLQALPFAARPPMRAVPLFEKEGAGGDLPSTLRSLQREARQA
jgi:hypothetical protein